MFRKLVANLSFSPALIAEVGFYARRLKKEQTTRRLTLVFVALALVVQSLAIFSPPESANASNEQDMLRGGVRNIEDLMQRYTKNETNFKDITTAMGIKEDELRRSESGSIASNEHALITGRLPRLGATDGELHFSYTRSDTGQEATITLSPLQLLNATDVVQTYDAWMGQSSQLGWFAVLKDSGNIVTKVAPQGAVKQNPSLKQEVMAINLSQGNVEADTIPATAGDRISYTITVKNDATGNQLTPLAIPLDDIMEYSSIIDDGGALFDEKSRTLSWSPIIMTPGQTEQRTFVVKLQNPLPATAHGTSNSMSYDCRLTTSYGTTSNIIVDCPPAKDLETILSLLPPINSTGNIIFGLIIAGISSFFYLRTRQMKEEIRLIRHNLNEGTL